MTTLEYINTYKYACHITESVNIFLNQNVDGKIGIIVVPKNKYEPKLMECINGVKIHWEDVSILNETRYYAAIPEEVCNNYFDELVKLNP